MLENGLISERPVQLIVNEYTPGQGIAAHTDAKLFGDTIISLSLGSSCGFVFTLNDGVNNDGIEYFVKPRTLMIMNGPSRSDWKHCIPSRKTDKDIATGETVPRTVRISLTFRTIKTCK